MLLAHGPWWPMFKGHLGPKFWRRVTQEWRNALPAAGRIEVGSSDHGAQSASAWPIVDQWGWLRTAQPMIFREMSILKKKKLFWSGKPIPNWRTIDYGHSGSTVCSSCGIHWTTIQNDGTITEPLGSWQIPATWLTRFVVPVRMPIAGHSRDDLIKGHPLFETCHWIARCFQNGMWTIDDYSTFSTSKGSSNLQADRNKLL